MRRHASFGIGGTLLAIVATSSVARPQQEAPGGRGVELSAPITGVVYGLTVTDSTVRRRRVHVDMSFSVSSSAPVVLSLPAWTPGAYEISYFARGVIGFGAAGDGKPLSWDKLDYDTWRIRPAGARAITVSFDYLADTLDNAMSWTQPDFALVNGTNVFPYPEGRGFDFPAIVRIRTDSGWRVATGMTPGPTAGSYVAGNYHDLVDMPFFIGRFDFDSTRAGRVWLRFASYPRGSVPADERAKTLGELVRIVQTEGVVFQDTPFDRYTVMQIADSGYGGISGLEHQNSHVDVTTPLAIGDPILTSIYAHEIFHAWNVKRLRPADLWPYQYAHEQPTPWLWVSEGVTDYYADLAEVRAGVTDSVTFFRQTADKITQVANTRPVGLEDASLTTWIHPEDGTGDIYYAKGSLAGFMLDVLIRDATDNRASLDDVMRSLYRSRYQQGHGFTGDDWWKAVSAAAGGRSFADFASRYVDGRDPYPWDSILPLAGLRLRADTLRAPAALGVSTAADSAGLRVVGVAQGSVADEAGVLPGDYLVSIAGIPVTERGFVVHLRAKLGTTEGAPVEFQLRRHGYPLTLVGKLRVETHISMRLEVAPAASPKAVRIRTGILHGRVGR